MIGLPNPWAILAAVGVAVGAFFYGSHVGHTAEAAKYATTQLLIEKVREAAQQGAASEIAKIQVHNTTIKAQTETLTREVPVYHDCRNTPDVMRLLNDALGGEPGTLGPSGGVVPGPVPAH